jgi:hypothetical protein
MKLNHPGQSLGPASIKILQDLHANGKSHRLDIEMRTGLRGITSRLGSLVDTTYLRRIKTASFDGYAIANKGSMTIGVAVRATEDDAPAARVTRICNASSRLPFNPATDVHMGRIGLARIGMAGRVGVAA